MQSTLCLLERCCLGAAALYAPSVSNTTSGKVLNPRRDACKVLHVLRHGGCALCAQGQLTPGNTCRCKHLQGWPEQTQGAGTWPQAVESITCKDRCGGPQLRCCHLTPQAAHKQGIVPESNASPRPSLASSHCNLAASTPDCSARIGTSLHGSVLLVIQ